MTSPPRSRATWTAALIVGVVLTCVLASCASQPPPLRAEVKVTVEGAGRVVSPALGIDCPAECSAEVELGTSHELTAAPDTGHLFVGWGGTCEGEDAKCTIMVAGPSPVTATFAKAPIVVDDVGGGSGGPACALRDAIMAANTDQAVAGCAAGQGADVIQLPADAVIVLTEPLGDFDGATGLPSITTEVTIRGSGATVQRDATTPFRLLHVSEEGSLRLEDLALQGGFSGASDGGAVYVDGGTLTAVDVTFEGNRVGAGRSGGAVHNEAGVVVLTDVSMFGNSSPGEGSGGVGTGSAIANAGGVLEVVGSQFRGNGGLISGERGVIATLGFDGYTSVVDTVIADNGALGVFNAGELHLERVEVSLSASEQLGGIVNEGVAFLTEVTVEANDGELVSGILNSGFVRLRSSSVTNHRTVLGFTGVRNDGIMEVIDSVVADNDSSGSSGVGGGITNTGRLTLVGSQVVGNRADEGGGVRNTGELILIGSLVDANQATSGGGVYSAGSVDLLDGSTVGGDVGNVASFRGGGIYVATSAATNRVALEGGSAVRGNVAGGDGGGVYAEVVFELALCGSCAIEMNSSDAGVGGGIYAPGVGFGSVFAPGIRDNSPDAVAPGALVVLSVGSSAGDAEELREASSGLPAGTVRLDEGTIDLPYDAGLDAAQYAGLRFTGVTVPAGAAVVDARLVFTAAADGAGQAALIVGVEDSIFSAPFMSADLDLSKRPRIGSTFWQLPPWQAGESGPNEASPSLRNQVQQLVDTPGWLPGSPLTFVLESATDGGSTATRTAYAYDGDPSRSARLWLLYFDPPGP